MATELRERKRLRAELESVMGRRGLRSTSQRRLILDRLFEIGEHFTADDLIADVRQADPSVGSATVYRTLDLLMKAGLVREHDFGDGFRRYEARPSRPRHEHLVCTRCGKVIEFESEAVDRLEQEIAGLHRFRPSRHRLEIYGLCEECHD